MSIEAYDYGKKDGIAEERERLKKELEIEKAKSKLGFIQYGKLLEIIDGKPDGRE